MRNRIRTTLAAASAMAVVSVALVACSPSASPTDTVSTEPPISSVPAAPSGSESPSASPSESPEN